MGIMKPGSAGLHQTPALCKITNFRRLPHRLSLLEILYHVHAKKSNVFSNKEYFPEFSLTNGCVCGLMTNNDIRKTLKENSSRITECRELTVAASQFPGRVDLAPELVL